MAREFSLSYLTIPGVEPLEQIKIAKDAGYDYVSLRTIPMGQPGEPQVCLEKDPELAASIRRALQDTGMRLLDIELVRVREDLPDDFRGAFEEGAKLGATQVLSSIWTKDKSFAVDRLGSICEQAAQFGLTMNLEFPVVSEVTTLAETLSILDQVNAPNLKILMDMIYVHLDKVTPEQIGLIHLCDWPKVVDTELVNIVRGGRAYCGEGAVDLGGLLKALPANPCAIELPNVEQIEKLGRAGHAKRCLDAAKAVFAANGL